MPPRVTSRRSTTSTRPTVEEPAHSGRVVQQGVILLPSHSIRVSDRAERVRLTMSRREGLVVVVPRGFDVRGVPAVLAAHHRWIERAAARIERERGWLEPEPVDGRPVTATLRALGEEWRIVYRQTGAARVAVSERPDRHLLVYGGMYDADACRASLRRWLHRKAKRELVPWLERVSHETGLRYERSGVRSQRSRWGSCSTRDTITLNAKCLFLPADLVEHVMLHELCHTVRHDHSEHFHETVRSHAPDASEKDARLKTAWRFVPLWAEA
jgi:predicted metal-dependent hydrolase